MSVFNRLSDIINANVNALLDQAEDPEKMVRLITQEMEETLVEVRSASARNIADKKQIEKKIHFIRREAGLWEEKAAFAITRDRDDLARAALREKSKYDETATRLTSELLTIEGAIARLKQDTNQLEEKLRLARVRQKALVMRGNTARSRLLVKRQLQDATGADTLHRFEQYERKLDEMEGEIESYELANPGLADEIASLEGDEKLDADLKALKKKVTGPGA
jgi:phage shock protein A